MIVKRIINKMKNDEFFHFISIYLLCKIYTNIEITIKSPVESGVEVTYINTLS